MSAALQTVSPDQVEAARAELWRRGELRYRLRKHQKPIYDELRLLLWGIGAGGSYAKPKGTQLKYLLKCHRRFGKSGLCAFVVNEMGQQLPNARMNWAAETTIQVEKIILPNMDMATRDCPKDLKPEWKNGAFHWHHTGAVLYTSGCEDERKADRLLGDASDLFILDEAGSIWPLEYVYKQVVLWMGSDRDGVVIMPSTPAKTPAHYFRTLCIKAEAGDGGYAERTVYDSEWDEARLKRLADECGGTDTTEWRRQALAEDVIDETRAIIPEFSEHKDEVVCEWPRPEYFDCYTGMDVGYSPSMTGLGFAIWDFPNAVLSIEDEAELSKMTTDVLAETVHEKESGLWSEHFEQMRETQPFREDLHEVRYRVSDVSPILLADLATLHKLYFSASRKDNLDAAINKVRLWIKTGKLRIHPRCKRLIAQLEAGIWNQRRTSFQFVDGFGHFDLIAMLVYLVRAIDEQRNPFPTPQPGEGKWVSPKHRKKSDAEKMRRLFKRRMPS